MSPTPISNEEFERRFDVGEDVLEYLDMTTLRPLKAKAQRVNVDFPVWMVSALDNEASRMGITRQSLIKVVVNAHLQTLAQRVI